jgi:hypothetical protein
MFGENKIRFENSSKIKNVQLKKNQIFQKFKLKNIQI